MQVIKISILTLIISLWFLSCRTILVDENTHYSSDFYLGADLSYVNEMQDFGAVYKRNGEIKDPYSLFHDIGTNLVRIRLWHAPRWTEYSTLEDVGKSIKRAHENKMAVLLDIHYSDEWADPSKQFIPEAWKEKSKEEMVQSVYDYTLKVLLKLNEKGLLPEIVQIGNETNSGMLRGNSQTDWNHQADLFNAGIRAVDDISIQTDKNVQTMLHIAQPENSLWWFDNIQNHGVHNFDIIGLSYYPQWSKLSISETGSVLARLKKQFKKEVMIVETGYPWTRESSGDSANNVLTTGLPEYPVSVEGQNHFMFDLVQTSINNGALGVVYWEPAWVSTTAKTLWGTGSHWENASFFDYIDNELHRGADYLSSDYISAEKSIPKENIFSDSENDSYLNNSQLDLLELHVGEDVNQFAISFTVNGDISAKKWGYYIIYLDTIPDSGADSVPGRRPISFTGESKPEFSIVLKLADLKGQDYLMADYFYWNGNDWEPVSFTGAISFESAFETSKINLQLLKKEIGNPESLKLALITTGKGPVHSAADILGQNWNPNSWMDVLILKEFFSISN